MFVSLKHQTFALQLPFALARSAASSKVHHWASADEVLIIKIIGLNCSLKYVCIR